MFEVKISEVGTGRSEYVEFPIKKYELLDALDRARIFGEYTAEISEIGDETGLHEMRLSDSPTVDELNFLAKRLEEICTDKCTALAYNAVISQYESASINTAINATYGLDSVPVFPCSNAAEYGEIVLENEMLEELNELPIEIYELLDCKKVGKIMQEREDGVFLDGYYIVPTSYEPQLVCNETLPEKMDDWLFKLTVYDLYGNAPNKSPAETITLPTSNNSLKAAEKRLRIPFADSTCMHFQTQISRIDSRIFGGTENIYELNEIARTIVNLPRHDLMKFKAVLDAERPETLAEIKAISSKLDSYEFDPSVVFLSAYGEQYLSKMLPPEFDKTLIAGELSLSFSRKIAEQIGVKMTDYGIISSEGGQLFSMVEQEQTAEPTMSL